MTTFISPEMVASKVKEAIILLYNIKLELKEV